MATVGLIVGGAVYVGLVILVARLIARFVPVIRENMIYGLSLVLTAGQYVEWAMATGDPGLVRMEAAGFVVFAALAIRGFWRPMALSAGWALHALWDFGLHPMPETVWVPWWFPALCVGYDIALAAYIARRAGAGRPVVSSAGTAGLAAVLVIAGPAVGLAQPPASTPAPAFEVGRAAGPIRIDGVLDEPAWRSAVAIPLSWEWSPGDNVAPPVRSTCHVAYDAQHFYIGCRADDPDPRAIRAHLADRDARAILQQDDHFMFLIDTFNDSRRAFEFRVNAKGVQVDALFTSVDMQEDFSWDAIWASAGTMTDEGYAIEVAIPFRSLRFPKTAGPQTWRFLAERSWPRNVRHRMQSAPRDRRNACLLCQANTLAGLSGITPGRNAEVATSFTASRTDVRPHPASSMQRGTSDGAAGLDVRWSPTPNVSVNGTVNPDFSQVEADVAQLDVNTRFALSYAEKRPFFLEAADVFATPVTAVFTRTVADPSAGAKVTGKAGRQMFGVFVARDRTTNVLLPANQGSRLVALDQEQTILAARVRRDVGRASHVGAIFTGRSGDGYTNNVVGIDLFHQIGRSNSLRAQVLWSGTEDPAVDRVRGRAPSATTRSGAAMSAEFVHWSRAWVVRAKYQDFSPEFRADAGFVPRVDTRSLTAAAIRLIRRPKGWFTQINAGVFAGRTEDHRGVLTDQYIGAELHYAGPRQTTVGGGVYRIQERSMRGLQDLTTGALTATMRPGRDWHLGLALEGGGAIDYATGRAGSRMAVSPSLEVSVSRVTASVSHTSQRLSVQGREVFTAHLLQPRITWHLTRRLMARTIVQFRQVDRPAAVPGGAASQDRAVVTQWLVAYKVNPQTMMFVGYGDSQVGTTQVRMTRMGRTFFVKLGYAWRP